MDTAINEFVGQVFLVAYGPQRMGYSFGIPRLSVWGCHRYDVSGCGPTHRRDGKGPATPRCRGLTATRRRSSIAFASTMRFEVALMLMRSTAFRDVLDLYCSFLWAP